MAASIPIFCLDELVSPDELLKFPFSRIKQDWHGRGLNYEASFALAISPNYLQFASRCSLKPHCDAIPVGTFTDGLWTKNVSELFLKENNGNRYQEFNFSPSGAWWTSAFSAYRTPETRPTAPSAIKIEVKKFGVAGWQIAATIPLSSLLIETSLKKGTHANVAFMLGQDNRDFLSWSTPLTDKPDFHLVNQYAECSQKRLVNINIYY